MARLTRTLRLSDPIFVAGQTIGEIVLREPTVGDFGDVGPLTTGRRRPGLEIELDVPGRVTDYLRRGLIANAAPEMLTALLAAMSLADGVRLKRALTGFLFDTSRDHVNGLVDALVFDWRLMTLDAADALGMADLARHAIRLTDHCRRRAAPASKRGGR